VTGRLTSIQLEVLASVGVTVHRLAVLVRSLEPGRFGTTVTSWFARQVERRDDLKLDVVDLTWTSPADLPGRIAAAGAIVVVTPEYNHSYPGELKLAIDAVRKPWAVKPVGFGAQALRDARADSPYRLE